MNMGPLIKAPGELEIVLLYETHSLLAELISSNYYSSDRDTSRLCYGGTCVARAPVSGRNGRRSGALACPPSRPAADGSQ